MTTHLWTQYIFALIVVAVVLLLFAALVKALGRGRIVLSADRRLVTVLESTPLGAHGALHVIKIGGRYLLVSSAASGTRSVIEIPAEDIDGWMAAQRAGYDVTKRAWSSILSLPWSKR
ncbi:MAG: flagellar biosynthetic protein FliO [Candidatus Eremiobacteraeota bacterium]|nr:flagellar biosynthetic protein FliO [Candidatus Eremiobacteraeota bacterium]